MNTLAFDGGPGPWVLLFPLVWAAVVITVVTVLRRTVWRGRRGPWQARAVQGGPAETSPITMLGRRFAAGEIDEDEYWRRLSVLDEQFGIHGKGGAA
ncbi:SHOCT domain-containing protein [Streptomyces sp. NBC_00876]|uniref:SHOCT domain-containing protein n=1 Tax=Streptomyces sp. NBC_00876 TaxID=2975853 RepID=UPI00386A1A53|nr:SHOCT domain-containing protein [Streptomyces sp. NBC_00876]